MRKVWIFTDSLEKNGWGLYTQAHLKILIRLGYSISLFTTKRPSEKLNFEVEEITILPKFQIYNRLKISVKLRRDKPEVIHFCTEPVGKQMNWLKHNNMIQTIHGTYGYLFSPIDLRNRKVIFDSHFTQERFSSSLKSKKNYLLFPLSPLIIDCFDRGVFFEKNPLNKNTILFIGNSKPRKGLETLLNSLETVMIKVPDLELIIIGSIKEEHHKRIKSMSINFKNYINIPEELLINIISQSQLNILPSQNEYLNDILHFEGYGLVHLESNYLGLYTIGSDQSGNTDIIDHRINGSIIKQKDHFALGEEIIWALSNKKRKIDILKFIHKKINPDIYSKEIQSIYNENIN